MTLFSKTFAVLPEHAASIVGSGSLNVLSTPSLIAFIENTAFLYVQNTLELTQTTVGVDIQVQHLKATQINNTITINILSCQKEQNKILFNIAAYESDKLIAKSTHTRFIINIETFLNKLK